MAFQLNHFGREGLCLLVRLHQLHLGVLKFIVQVGLCRLFLLEVRYSFSKGFLTLIQLRSALLDVVFETIGFLGVHLVELIDELFMVFL